MRGNDTSIVPAKRKKVPASSTPNGIPYPEDSLRFVRKDDGKHYKALQINKELAPTLTVDLEPLKQLKVDTEVRDLLVSSGLAILIDSHKVASYRTPTFEFASTFERYDNDGEHGWSFQLGGVRHSVSSRWLCELFQFPIGGSFPSYDVATRDAFWKEISGIEYFVPMMSPKMINVGIWKIIHRVVTMSFLARKEGGRLVHNSDIDIMIAMKKGEVIDWIQVLGNMFENFWKPLDVDNHVVGGSVFVTLIARELGFDLSELVPFPTKPFTLTQLMQYHILTSDKKNWVVDTDMPVRIQQAFHNRQQK